MASVCMLRPVVPRINAAKDVRRIGNPLANVDCIG
jgi:hypothetical protein